MSRVVIIGSGPVGLRCAQEVLSAGQHTVTLFGNEPWQPYNRVRLSGFLGGEYDTEQIALPELEGYGEHFQLHSGSHINRIDRGQKTLISEAGEQYPYDDLVLATGSRAHLPNIENIGQHGVYTFRNFKDALALQARQASARHVVVIGGGLLGLEAARAMRIYHTQVTVIEHNHHLMYQQLDAVAGDLLQQYMEDMNVQVMTGNSVKRVLGEERVTGVELLRDGEVLTCDTVIVATGIRPNLELARDAGLATDRGITVNHYLQTKDPHIYAIGDCAEYDGQIYGLIAPGYEQAAVVANHLNGGEAEYHGSLIATSLKVAGCPVFSMGNTDAMRDTRGEYTYQDKEKQLYRRLHIERGYLEGGLAIGDWPEKGRLQEAIQQGRLLWPWQRWNFMRRGEPWSDEAEKDVGAWPASSIVCNCTGVTCGQLSVALESGCNTVDCLSRKTGASSVCGSCKPHLQALLGSSAPPEPADNWKLLQIFGWASVLLGLIFLLLPGLPYPDSVTGSFQWDVLWRDSQARQISGFSLLGGGALIASIFIRKRSGLQWGNFSLWRLLHVVLGGALLLLLLIHTGARIGDNLNLWLMLSFTGVLLSGGLLGASIANEHLVSPAIGRRLRSLSLWVHLLLLWPLPVLLGFHILKAYYF